MSMRKLLVLVGACLVLLVATLAWSWATRAPGRDVSPPVEATVQPRETPTALEELDAGPASEIRRDAVVAAEVAEVGSTSTEPGSDVSNSATLSILVRSEESGEPIQGVRMLLWPDPQEVGFGIMGGETSSATFGTSPVSDEHGRARIGAPAGRRFRLATQSDVAGPAELAIEPLTVGEQREVELRLAMGTDLHFVARVVDDGSGEPLADALVRVGQLNDVGREQSEPQIPVDGSGYFEIDVRSWLGHVARVDAPGYAWQPTLPSAGHETRATAREIRLRRAAVVEAQIVARGPMRLDDILVELSADYHELGAVRSLSHFVFSSEPARWSAFTDALGRCRIEGLPPGVSLDLSARRSGDQAVLMPDKLSLEAGETRAIEIALGGGAVVSGGLRAVDDAVVEGAEIWLVARSDAGGSCPQAHQSESARVSFTDADGRFRFEQVPDGEWLVGCEPDGPFAPETAIVVVADGRADREPSLTADASLYIRGRVVGPDEQPVEGQVFGVGGESGCFASGDCAVDGTFSLGPLVRGSYTLTASYWGGAGSSLMYSESVQAEAGASDVTLVLRRGGAISGRVVDPLTGSGVQADIVAVGYGTPEDEGAMWMCSSSEDGTFRLDGLQAGTYALAARTPGVQIAIRNGIQLADGQELADQRLSLEPGARLRIRYAGEAAHCGVRIRIDGVPVVGDGLARGNDSTFVVPAGALTVECTEYFGTTRSSRSKSVEVAVGGLASIEFGGD